MEKKITREQFSLLEEVTLWKRIALEVSELLLDNSKLALYKSCSRPNKERYIKSLNKAHDLLSLKEVPSIPTSTERIIQVCRNINAKARQIKEQINQS